MARNDRERRVLQSAADQFRRPLLRYAARLAGQDHAEDVVQETLTRLCSGQSQPPPGRLAPWLFMVCRNIAIDLCRKEGRVSLLTESQSQGCVDGRASPPEQAQQREAAAGVLAALGTLSGNQQEVIRLRFQNGFSYRQIADITGLSTGNVGLLIHNAIKALRQKVAPDAAAGDSGRNAS